MSSIWADRGYVSPQKRAGDCRLIRYSSESVKGIEPSASFPRKNWKISESSRPVVGPKNNAAGVKKYNVQRRKRGTDVQPRPSEGVDGEVRGPELTPAGCPLLAEEIESASKRRGQLLSLKAGAGDDVS